MKKIIICCDGTWNSPDEKKNGIAVPTNVTKLTRALLPTDANKIDQVVFYDQGVGTEGSLTDKYLGGGTGWGISKNIIDCYRFLANNYHDGDEIYCFGFSRGAYTARAVGGLVAWGGLLAKHQLENLPDLYELSRVDPKDREKDPLYKKLQPIIASTIKPRIKFMGVWDTVGALGAPTPMLSWITKKLWVKFHDTSLRNVDYAYHALAADELREPFRPSVWTGANDNIKEIKQVWFAGSHSNVGGGFPDAGLSDIAFSWMIKMASLRGLEFNQSYLTAVLKPNSQGELVNLYKGVYLVLGAYPRPIGQLHEDTDEKKVGVNEMMHQSLLDRYTAKLPALNSDNIDYGITHLPVEPY
jgi:uncharacterized protein (DUF2235 family)